MIYGFDGFELDEDRFELRAGGKKVAAQPKVLSFLLLLARNHPSTVERKELIAQVWGDVFVTDAALARVVMEARKAIGDASQERLVTVRGRGFRLDVSLDAKGVATPARAPVPPLAGRDPCLAALCARLEESLGGRRRVAFVSGPPGIGKTRVLEEIGRLASERGAIVGAASCRDVTGAPRFAPWVRVLHALFAGEEDHAALKSALEALDGGAVYAAAEAVSAALAARSSVVITLDDLPLADDDTVVVLELVGRHPSVAGALFVGAHLDQPVRGTALRMLLGDSGTLSIPLRALSADEVGRVVEAVTGVQPSAPLVTAIHARSGGVPHYVHQLIETQWVDKALRGGAPAQASSIDLQPGIVESISRHLDAISPEAQDVLVDAALLGRELSLATLAEATAKPRAELHPHLDEAVKARLLVATKNDGHEFAHALVGDVLRKRLSSAARKDRHHAIGERLLAHYGSGADLHAEELARHFVRALPEGDLERAVAFAIRAAEQNQLRAADAAAVKSWSNAAHALGFVNGYDPRRQRVQSELARARARAGDLEGAREACLDGALLARAFQKPEALVEAVFLYLEISEETDPRRDAMVREALRVVEDLPAETAAPLRERLRVVPRH